MEKIQSNQAVSVPWICEYCYCPVEKTKSIQLRSHSAGKVTWSRSYQTCDKCRKYLLGVFRYSRKE